MHPFLKKNNVSLLIFYENSWSSGFFNPIQFRIQKGKMLKMFWSNQSSPAGLDWITNPLGWSRPFHTLVMTYRWVIFSLSMKSDPRNLLKPLSSEWVGNFWHKSVPRSLILNLTLKSYSIENNFFIKISAVRWTYTYLPIGRYVRVLVETENSRELCAVAVVNPRIDGGGGWISAPPGGFS